MRPAEIFERSHVEPGFQLFDGVAALAGEVQQELDLFRRCGGIFCRLFAIGGLRGVLRRGFKLTRVRLRERHLDGVSGLPNRVSEFGLDGCTDEIERLVDFGVELEEFPGFVRLAFTGEFRGFVRPDYDLSNILHKKADIFPAGA